MIKRMVSFVLAIAVLTNAFPASAFGFGYVKKVFGKEKEETTEIETEVATEATIEVTTEIETEMAAETEMEVTTNLVSRAITEGLSEAESQASVPEEAASLGDGSKTGRLASVKEWIGDSAKKVSGIISKKGSEENGEEELGEGTTSEEAIEASSYEEAQTALATAKVQAETGEEVTEETTEMTRSATQEKEQGENTTQEELSEKTTQEEQSENTTEDSTPDNEKLADYVKQIPEIVSKLPENTKKTVKHIQETLAAAGINIQISAKEMGEFTMEKLSSLGEWSGKVADLFSEAAGYVMDASGNVIDMAAYQAKQMGDTVYGAYKTLTEKVKSILTIINFVMTTFDLTKEENVKIARSYVEKAITQAYKSGTFGTFVSLASVQMAARMIFDTVVYVYQFQQGQSTLHELVSNVSTMIIREMVPIGVGKIIGLTNLPKSEELARSVSTYVVSIATE